MKLGQVSTHCLLLGLPKYICGVFGQFDTQFPDILSANLLLLHCITHLPFSLKNPPVVLHFCTQVLVCGSANSPNEQVSSHVRLPSFRSCPYRSGETGHFATQRFVEGSAYVRVVAGQAYTQSIVEESAKYPSGQLARHVLFTV